MQHSHLPENSFMWVNHIVQCCFLPMAPLQGAQPVLMSVSGWWMTGWDVASQSAGVSGPSPSLSRGYDMCQPPMWHLTTALPPSSLYCAKSSPPYSASLCWFVFTINSLFSLLFSSLFSSLIFHSPSLLPIFIHLFAYKHSSHLQLWLLFSFFPFSCGFASLQCLTASPSNPVYLSFTVPFPSLKHHLYSLPSPLRSFPLPRSW